jgi:hypothetical protein
MSFQARQAMHDQFYEFVRSYLNDNGYEAVSSTYHEHWGTMAQRLIKDKYDPTSLYVRFRADNVAISHDSKRTFQWDAKTNQSPQYENMSLELLPLIIHKVIWEQLAVDTLYCYYDFTRKKHSGFWMHNFPLISRIIVPSDRQKSPHSEWLKALIEKQFPNIPMTFSYSVKGSGTPFVLIPAETVKHLPDWKDLVKEQ